MEVMHERVAGLDIGKASLTVCVRTPGPRGRRSSETRNNWNGSGTRWSSTQPPDPTAEELKDGLRPPRADARL